MKILYIVANPPSRVRTRPYNLIRYLVAAGHAVTVATLWGDEQERSEIEELRAAGIEALAAPLPKTQVVRNLLSAAASGLPLQARYAYSPPLARAIRSALTGAAGAARFDVVHIEHLRGAAYLNAVEQARAQLPYPLPVLWDSVDSITHLFRQAMKLGSSRKSRLVARLELGRTARYEASLPARFNHMVVTSPVDAAAFAGMKAHAAGAGSRHNAPGAISVLPNGVDLAYFTPGEGARAPATILFSGKMSYHANVSAALHLAADIMPHVWAQCPQARLVLAGKDPPGQLLRLAQVTPQISVTGTVPDLRPYLQRATVAVSPLVYGAGIQNKVLEAMACGAPVIASPPAVGALQAVAGQDLLVAEDDERFADAILAVLGDPALQARLSLAGRRYVESCHDWQGIIEHLEEIYVRIIKEARS